MFGLLKKKLNSFISSIAEKKEEPEEPKSEPPNEPAPPVVEQPIEPKEQPPVETIPEPKEPEPISEPIKEGPQKPVEELAPEPIKEEPKKEPELNEITQEVPKQESVEIPKEEKKTEQVKEPKPMETPKPIQPKPVEEKKPGPIKIEKKEEKKPFSVNLSLGSKVRSFISNEVEIRESDVKELTDNLNLSLLESDVSFEVAEHIVQDINSKLIGMKVPKNSLSTSIKNSVKESLIDVLSVEGIDLLSEVKNKEKPVKILLIGPNGAGKTTTMAKLANMFMKNNLSCVFSASDTFRAAAIEQAEKHGEKLGIRVIKHKYGSDPTAVAFDSVNYARANNIDVVLIDSAGRQETNRNLLDEMKKISRVVAPDFKIFIGESIAGNALVEQVKSFSGAIGLDGVILTKLDCDAKGGTALSLAKATGVPILYFGIGQAYDDLLPFDAENIADQIMS